MAISFPQRITGQRVTLRAPRRTDADQLHAEVCSHDDVARYLTWQPHDTVETTRDVLDQILKWNEADEQTWLLVDEADHPIGMFTCWWADRAVELGFCLGPRHWGRGLMQAALSAVIAHLRGRGDVERIWATTDVDNDRSAATLRRAGLEQVEVLSRHAVHPNISAQARDSLLFETSVDAAP